MSLPAGSQGRKTGGVGRKLPVGEGGGVKKREEDRGRMSMAGRRGEKKARKGLSLLPKPRGGTGLPLWAEPEKEKRKGTLARRKKESPFQSKGGGKRGKEEGPFLSWPRQRGGKG